MIVFFDTSVLLDLLDGDRAEHNNAKEVLKRLMSADVTYLCSWNTLATIDYLLSQKWGSEKVYKTLSFIIEKFSIPDVGKLEAQEALKYSNDDFEGGMQIVSAIKGNADLILTREVSGGFNHCPIPVKSPAEFLKGEHSIALRY